MSLSFENAYTTAILPISEEFRFTALPERGEAHSRSGTHSFPETQAAEAAAARKLKPAFRLDARGTQDTRCRKFLLLCAPASLPRIRAGGRLPFLEGDDRTICAA